MRVTVARAATPIWLRSLRQSQKAIGPTIINEQMSDRHGRETNLVSPDSGGWAYQYNGAGELVLQIDAGQSTHVLRRWGG